MLIRSAFTVLERPPGHAPEVSVTGLCFEPKALFVYVPQSGTPGTFSGPGTDRGPGAAFFTSWVAQLGSDYGQRSHWDAGSVAFDEEEGPTLAFGAFGMTLSSYDPDGFTVSITTFGSFPIYWTAIGGANLEAYAGSFPVFAGDTSSIPVTGVGFQPDFLFAQTGVDENTIAASVSMGMASSASHQASMSGAMGVFGAVSGTLLDGYLLCPHQVMAGGNTCFYRAQLASFDSDGFTVDVPFNTGSGGNSGHYLAIKDPDSSFKVGIETQKTAAGSKSTTGTGFQPGGGIFLGSYKTVSNDTTYAASPDGTPMFSFGSADGLLNQSCELEFNTNGGFGGHNQNGYSDEDIVLAIGDFGQVLLATGALTSWDVDGFTLNWAVSDGIARYFIYGVFETDRNDPCLFPFTPQIYRRLPAFSLG
jgi:hypothetical protein